MVQFGCLRMERAALIFQSWAAADMAAPLVTLKNLQGIESVDANSLGLTVQRLTDPLVRSSPTRISAELAVTISL
jgi:hypothetical protein